MEDISPSQLREFFENALADRWKYGGEPTTYAYMAPAVERKLKAAYEGFTTPYPDAKLYKIHTEFGDIEVVVSLYCPTDKIYLSDRLRPKWEELA